VKRRIFIGKAGLIVFSTSVSGFTFTNFKGQLKGECSTTSDALGLYFREGAPISNDLNYTNRKGTALKVEGKLFTSACKKLLPEKTIKIWH